MKKITFLLLFFYSIISIGQVSSGMEQEFDYGIKNNSTQTITTPPYLTTTGMDGTQGKIPSALIAKTSDVADSLATKENVSNKSDSYTASSSTTYTSTKALVEGLGTKQNTLTNPVTGTFVAGRVPYTSSNSTLTDSSKLLWNNTNSYFEVNGNAPRFTLKNNLNNYSTYFTNNANGILILKNHQDKTLAVFSNPVNSTSQPQMAIGNVSSIPVESQLYVYGGMNGANIDARGSVTADEANIDLEGVDWETNPNSIGLSYFGSNATSLGTVLGYAKNKLGIIRFQDTNYAIINSEKAAGVSPIRFGINNIEIGNVNDKGFSYQSDFSSVNSSNPRWLADKAYVDTKAPLSGSSSYIQNQNAAPQTANMWISGSANYGTGISITSLNGKEIQFYNVGVSPAILKVADDVTSINSIVLYKSGAVANVVVPNGTVTASNGTLIGGTITSGYIPKATGANSLGNSVIYDDGGGNVGIGNSSPSVKLEVTGTIKATSYTGSATLTGTPTAPTATAGTNTTQIATTAFVSAAARPYKVYTALLSQSGTSAPTATVLENTIGAIVWSRSVIGGYFATLSGAFTTDKTSVLITNGSANATYIHGAQVSTSNVNVITVADGQIDKATIEIRVYN